MGIPQGDNVKREYAGEGSITWGLSEFSRIRLYGELRYGPRFLPRGRVAAAAAADRRGVPAARSGHRRARRASVLMRTTLSQRSLMLVVGAPRAEAKVHVVTTIETFADLAQARSAAIASRSSRCRTATWIRTSSSPSRRWCIDLNRADLLVHVGLELEIGWLPPLVLGSRNEKIGLGMPGNLDASTQIPVLDVPTDEGRPLDGRHPSAGQPALLDPARQRA